MKRLTQLLAAFALLASSAAAVAAQEPQPGQKYPRFRFGFDAVQAWQVLRQHDDSNTLPDITSGIQAALGNARMYVTLTEGINIYAELYLSSTHHLGQVFDREGYVRIDRLPRSWDFLGLSTVFKHINLKAGHFEVDYGDQHLVRSDNAEVQRNPLIGNYLVDPNTVEAGLEVIGTEGPVRWVAGIGDGGTTQDFQPKHHYSMHGKLGVVPKDSVVNFSASIYRVNQSGNPVASKGGSWTEMFAGNRSGSRYAAVLGGGPDAGQLLIGKGQDLTAWQLDGAVKAAWGRVSGLYGWVRDADVNGSDPGTPEERWVYYGVETKLDLAFDMIYVAGRYSGAAARMLNGTSSNARVNRFQVGGGLWLADGLLFKLEYVDQTYRRFPTGSAYVLNPRFHGVLFEGSVSF